MSEPHWPEMPLLDRERQAADLYAAFARTCAGRGQVVVVTGESGSGKTSLVRGLIEHVSASGAEALIARSYDGDMVVPYAPWQQLVSDHADLATLLPQPIGRATSDAANVMDLGRQTASVLTRVFEQRPAVLVFDDLHWADESSLAVLRAVMQRAHTAPILMILMLATPLAETSPAHGWLPMVARESDVAFIELPPISTNTILAFLDEHDAAPATVREQLADDLLRLSGGNGLFLSELWALLASSSLGLQDALLYSAHALPANLTTLVERRIAGLSREAVDTLRLAALLGEVIDLDLLIALRATDPENVLADLDDAIQLGLLVEDRRGVTTFRHGILRNVLIDQQSHLRRRRQHAAILQHLRARSGSRLSDIAFHAREAGESQIACDAFEAAGIAASQVFALAEAAVCYRSVLDLGRDGELDPAREDRIRLALADCLYLNDRTAAIREVEKVVTRSAMRGDEATLARAQQRSAMLLYESGQRTEALTVLQQVIPRLERVGDETVLADALAYLGYCSLSLDDFMLLEQTADRLTRLAIFDSDPAIRAATLYFKSIALVGRGQPEGAPRMARESFEILAELGQLDLAGAYAAVTLMRVDLLANLHNPDMVDDLVRRGEELDTQCQRQLELPTVACAIEFVYGHFLRGDWDYVRANLRDPIAIRAESIPQVVRDIVHNVAAEIAEAEERLGDAETLLHYIAPTPSSPLRDHTFQQWLLAIERLISIRLRLHDHLGARAWFEAMDAALEQHVHVPGELLLQLSLARIHLAEGDAKAAYQVAVDAVEGANRTSNTLVVVRGLRLLAQASQQLGKPVDALNAATAAIEEAHRCRLVYEVAMGLLERASIALNTSGSEESGWADLAEARQIFERIDARSGLARCEDVARSHQRSKGTTPAGLTGRELEVLRLLATGMSDRQIGEELFISARTVTTHVSNLLGKTATSNRTELALWAAERKLAGRTHAASTSSG